MPSKKLTSFALQGICPLGSHFALISTALRHSRRISVVFRPQCWRWLCQMKYVFAARCPNCFSALSLSHPPTQTTPNETIISALAFQIAIYTYICIYICYIYIYVGMYIGIVYILFIVFVFCFILKVSSSLAVAYRLVRTPAHVIHIYTHMYGSYLWGCLLNSRRYFVYSISWGEEEI